MTLLTEDQCYMKDINLYHEIIKKALIRHRYYLCDCLPDLWNDNLVNKDCIECLKEVITEYGWGTLSDAERASKRVDIQSAFTKYSDSKEIKDWVALGMPYTSAATWEYKGVVNHVCREEGKVHYKPTKGARIRNKYRDELWKDLTKTIDNYNK